MDVNVGDGFLPHFATAFVDRYGRHSEFVRAVSDLFTLALAQLLERAGRLDDPADVALFSDERTVAALRELIRVVETMRQPLFQEALGTSPIGTMASVVEESLGEGVFTAWLQSFEARDFEACRRHLCRRS